MTRQILHIFWVGVWAAFVSCARPQVEVQPTTHPEIHPKEWLGKPIERVLEEWGHPERILFEPDQGRIYEFRRTRLTRLESVSTFYDRPSIPPPSPAARTVECTVRLRTSPQGIVTNWEFAEIECQSGRS